MVSVHDRYVSELLAVMYRSDVRRSRVVSACCCLVILTASAMVRALYQSKSPQTDFSRDLHRRAAYSVCESWFLIHQDVYHDLFVCS